ncbi:sortase-associated OmpA-like protein PdsO [Salinivibrio kushneri]|uniref:sortase-associated OmpA-like protein PdsO n=1 Tax=Salinivibrio kushneri TaxID=1908198 RepID=UPI0022B3134D|nr:sortase-associated OmpA-like protein PdsO [Salinivibrio kushneri]WBA19605.1 sortase-associated OmpA-like protein PdsO [Salinivibrio kushneri]
MDIKKALTHSVFAVSMFAVATPQGMAASEVERNKQPELIGMGSGAIAGAVVAGPVGAVAGAIIGTVMGQNASYEDLADEQGETIQTIRDENQSLSRISQKYNEAQLELARLRSAQHQVDDLALAMNIQFRTSSADIEPHFMIQLDELAGFIQQMPNAQWLLAGYADPRGRQGYNQALSERRVQAVKDYLVSVGVDPHQLNTVAYGDSQPLDNQAGNEGFFFDRRVTVSRMADTPTDQR